MSDTTSSTEEAPIVERSDMQKMGDILLPIAIKQYDAAVTYRQPKLDAILKAEELYFNKVVKSLRGRFNVPLPIVSGFVDTLLAKIDDEISINYDATNDADKIRARKLTAAWKYDSGPTRGMWAIKDLLVKKLAIFSGRGIFKIFSESDPTYKNYLGITDPFNFLAEPNGGWWLENHLFCGEENIFRTKDALETGPQYDQGQVSKLVVSSGGQDYKDAHDLYMNSQRRHNNMGLDPITNNYVGNQIFALVEWNMEHEGKRYYLFFDPRAKIWVRCCPLEEITGEAEDGEDFPTYMWKSWATHYDAWNFWSKAPVDDVVPVAVAIKTVCNFMMDDVQKRLWGQRIFDQEFFDDPNMLEWDRPDKIVMASVPTGKSLSQGVYEFQTGDKSTITVNLIDYMRNFIGTESGVTPQAKGNTDEKLLGLAKINEGEVADRLGLTNKFYVQCDTELGSAYKKGLKMCCPEKMLIRMIGETGEESSWITPEDLDFTSSPNIRVTGGQTEARKSELLQQKKTAALTSALTLAPDIMNKKITVQAMLENGGFELDEITPLLDVSTTGDEMQSVRAHQAIQMILKGQKPPLYKGATNRFAQIIIKFSDDNITDDKINIELMKYGLAHKDIIIQNEARNQMLQGLTSPDNSMAPNPGEATPANPTPQPSPVAPALVPALAS